MTTHRRVRNRLAALAVGLTLGALGTGVYFYLYRGHLTDVCPGDHVDLWVGSRWEVES